MRYFAQARTEIGPNGKEVICLDSPDSSPGRAAAIPMVPKSPVAMVGGKRRAMRSLAAELRSAGPQHQRNSKAGSKAVSTADGELAPAKPLPLP